MNTKRANTKRASRSTRTHAAVSAKAPSLPAASKRSSTTRPRPEVYRLGFRVQVPEGQRVDGSTSARLRLIAVIFDPADPSNPTLAEDFAKMYAKSRGIDESAVVVSGGNRRIG